MQCFIHWFSRLDKKKATAKNPYNDDDIDVFLHTATIELNFHEIKKDLQRVLNTNHSKIIITGKDKIIHQKLNIGKDLKKKLTIALNILYIKEKDKCQEYILQINSDCEIQVLGFLHGEFF